MTRKRPGPRRKETIPANRDVLRWARNVRGLSLSEAAAQLAVTDTELTEIESGKLHPTTTTFDKMVAVYKQPESVLLLAQPPVVDPLPQDFRTVGNRRAHLTPETRLAIRDARDLQHYVSELVADDPQLISKPHLPTTESNSDPDIVATKERARLGLRLATQLQWSPGNESFERWRDFLERGGLLILLKKMFWNDCRGFSLLENDLLPTIVVNSQDAPAARIFTLFHEYAHLLLRNAGICQATAVSSTVEQWCNAFAGAFLVPTDELRAHIKELRVPAGPGYNWPLTTVAKLARHYRVSRPVIAIRLQALRLAAPTFYQTHKTELHYFDQPPEPKEPPKIKRKPGYKEKQKLKEVGITAASVILKAWKERSADAMEAADVLNLSIDELYGFQEQAELQRVRYVG